MKIYMICTRTDWRTLTTLSLCSIIFWQILKIQTLLTRSYPPSPLLNTLFALALKIWFFTAFSKSFHTANDGPWLFLKMFVKTFLTISLCFKTGLTRKFWCICGLSFYRPNLFFVEIMARYFCFLNAGAGNDSPNIQLEVCVADTTSPTQIYFSIE